MTAYRPKEPSEGRTFRGGPGVSEPLSSRLELESADYDSAGSANGQTTRIKPGQAADDPLIAILATHKQAVDDAEDMAERLREKFDLA
ncbi:hypothetical protein GORHZ_110_00160 [Gordonia rhizosphera NBRC 16068]|uniref:Uncharacterized protein n=1 Tax=Gordonia rhizosphera NBRC 16068 TaxID=1108045 RepID=K6WVL9_9ACTN|nr:hypothetical protein GORHZ_110_00160 [Gordonia rhizosphera NBRC 16068]